MARNDSGGQRTRVELHSLPLIGEGAAWLPLGARGGGHDRWLSEADLIEVSVDAEGKEAYRLTSEGKQVAQQMALIRARYSVKVSDDGNVVGAVATLT